MKILQKMLFVAMAGMIVVASVNCMEKSTEVKYSHSKKELKHTCSILRETQEQKKEERRKKEDEQEKEKEKQWKKEERQKQKTEQKSRENAEAKEGMKDIKIFDQKQKEMELGEKYKGFHLRQQLSSTTKSPTTLLSSPIITSSPSFSTRTSPTVPPKLIDSSQVIFKESLEKYKNTKLYTCKKDNIIFIKIELRDGKIIVYDCQQEKHPPIANATDFIKKTVDAFATVNSNAVGKKLLDDLDSFIQLHKPPTTSHAPVLSQSSASISPVQSILSSTKTTTNPIIIFSCDFIEKVLSYKNLLGKMNDYYSTLLPDEIKLLLTSARVENIDEVYHFFSEEFETEKRFQEWKEPLFERITSSLMIDIKEDFKKHCREEWKKLFYDRYKDKINTVVGIYTLYNQSRGSQFIPIGMGSTSFSNNLVLLDFQKEMRESVFGFKIGEADGLPVKAAGSGDFVKLEKTNYGNDEILFHELNHCRHFLKKIKTYRIISTKAQINNYKIGKKQEMHLKASISSNGIQLFSNTILEKFLMKDAEEELQLTGKTELRSGGAILDPINEINYVIKGNKKIIRFPYELYEYEREHATLFLRYEDAVKILKTATDDS